MRYLFYFIYLSWHWGFELALFVTREEIKGERKYGIRTIGVESLPGNLKADERKHFSLYEPVNYYSATWLLDQLKPADLQSSLLDVGCGRGRVLAMGAVYGFKDMIGIDFSKELCNRAEEVCNGVAARHPGTNIQIVCTDARDFDVPERVGVIFLFNPFDDTVMEPFIAKVQESLQRRRRPIKVLYANPQFKQLWLDAGFTETGAFEKKRILRGCVLEKM